MIRKYRRQNELRTKMKFVREERAKQHAEGRIEPRAQFKALVANYRRAK